MKIIHFFSDRQFRGLGQPQPIKFLLPEWYKKAEREGFKDGKSFPGLKKCVPFMDGMLSGYALVTPFDIHVSRNENGSLQITWDGPEEFKNYIVERDLEQGATLPRPAGHLPNHLAFSNPWGFVTPRGWSVLLTPPLNRYELPFTITSGIIDSDKYSTGGNVPFFMREDFQGTIPAGTPFAQVIPIKRADWHHVPNNVGKRFLNRSQGEFIHQEGHSYKKDFWQKKKYN
jgi:hypothetical protein